MPWFEAPEVEHHRGFVIGACPEKVMKWVWSDKMPRPQYSLSRVTQSTFDPACHCSRCAERKPTGRYLEPGVPVPPGQEWMITYPPPEEPLKPFRVRQAQQDVEESVQDQLSVDQLLRHGAWSGLRRDADERLPGDAPSGSWPDAPQTTVGDGEEFEDPEDPEGLGQSWMLKQGMSVVSKPEGHEGPEQWATEDYSVRKGILNDVKMRLQVEPQIDAFAD